MYKKGDLSCTGAGHITYESDNKVVEASETLVKLENDMVFEGDDHNGYFYQGFAGFTYKLINNEEAKRLEEE